jgi:hypothetical protein
MRFNTNLCESRQQWIQNVALYEQWEGGFPPGSIPHPKFPGISWVGAADDIMDGAWMTKNGSYATYIEGKPTFTTQQQIIHSNKRVAYGNARRAEIAKRIAKTGAPAAVKKSLWRKALGLLGRGVKLGSVFGAIDLFARTANAEEDYDWSASQRPFRPMRLIDGEWTYTDNGQKLGDPEIEPEPIAEPEPLPMGPFQDVNMYGDLTVESYKNRNHNTCLREQFYGF